MSAMGMPERFEGTLSARPHFLVVDDEKVLCREIGRILSAYGNTFLAGSLVDAHQALDTVDSWAGAVVDILLRPGSGLEVVDRLGVEHPALPVLVITGDLEPDRINRACRAGVCFLAKPFKKVDIDRFARSAIEGAEGRLRAALSAYAKSHRFCPAETEVLAHGVECEDHSEIAARRKCSLHTVQAHVASMLKKSGSHSFHSMVVHVLRDAAGLNACKASCSSSA